MDSIETLLKDRYGLKEKPKVPAIVKETKSEPGKEETEEEFHLKPLNRLFSIEGFLGMGKTAVATWWAFRDWLPKHCIEEDGQDIWLICKKAFKDTECPYCKQGLEVYPGKNIWTNYHTAFSRYYTVEEFIDHYDDEDWFFNCDLVIDEIGQMGDRRRAMSKLNFVLDKFLKSTRKRSCDVLFCQQRFKELDDRIQWAAQYRMICHREETSPIVTVALRKQRGQTSNNVSTFEVDLRSVASLYNTDERIKLPPGILKIKEFERAKKQSKMEEDEKLVDGIRL